MRVHVQLLQDRRLGVYELGVYLGLAAHAELQTGECFPAAGTLAKYINASDKAVRRAIAVLVETGYVQLSYKKGRANVYVLLPPPTLDSQSTLSPETLDSQSNPLDSESEPPWTDVPPNKNQGTRTNNEPTNVYNMKPQDSGCGKC
jgi:hypothetical protein